jgi:hypothetical protein
MSYEMASCRRTLAERMSGTPSNLLGRIRRCKRAGRAVAAIGDWKAKGRLEHLCALGLTAIGELASPIAAAHSTAGDKQLFAI